MEEIQQAQRHVFVRHGRQIDHEAVFLATDCRKRAKERERKEKQT